MPMQEKTILYRRYVTLHGLAISAAFAVAAAWIILSATRHSNAEAKCIQDFFSPSGSASSSSEGSTLCNIFPWVDVGIMGALWVLLAILQVSHVYPTFFQYLSGPQLYLFVIISSYGAAQRRDHDQYDRISDLTQPLTENIALGTHKYEHIRNPSLTSDDQHFTGQPMRP